MGTKKFFTCPKCLTRNDVTDVSPGQSFKCRKCDATVVLKLPEVQTLVGQVLGGCRIIEEVGRGGMGAVYKAHHIALNKTVALKVLPPELSMNKAYVERFIREARAAAQLEHPNIVQVFNVGQERGLYFIVMQFVEGESAMDKIIRGELSPQEALDIILQCSRGLMAAEEKGILHRDIKPDNILITSDGVARIADFGLARPLVSDEVTSARSIIGTPHYMSPEQVDGSLLDVRSDIYSLGATFYHLLTGKPPFDAPSPLSVLIMHKERALTPPSKVKPGIPVDYDVVVMRMMAKKPEDRYQNVRSLIEELVALKEGKPVASSEEVETMMVVKEEMPPPEEVVAPPIQIRRPSPEEQPARGVPIGRYASYFVWCLILAGMLAGAYYAIRHIGSRRSKPPEETKASAEQQRRLEIAKKAFEDAEKLALQYPGSYTRIAEKYRQVAERFSDTEFGSRARTKWAYYLDKKRKEVQNALTALNASIEELIKTEKFTEALERIADFKQRYQDAKELIQKAPSPDRVLEGATKRADELIKKADQLLAEGKIAEASALLDRIRGWKLEVVKPQEEKLSKLIESRRRASLLSAYGEFISETDPLVEEFKFTQALSVAKKHLARSPPPEVRSLILKRIEDINLLNSGFRRFVTELSKKKGRFISMPDIITRGTIGVKLVGVSLRTVVWFEAGMEERRDEKEWHAVTPLQLLKLLRTAFEPEQAEEHLFVATLLFERGLASEAFRHFETASKADSNFAERIRDYLWRDAGRMVYVPAGQFIMGNTVKAGGLKDEEPEAKRTLPGFFIDKFEVSNADYARFVKATGAKPPRGWKGDAYPPGTGELPVTSIDHDEAESYARWAGKRLPLEEEWEKACRGADGRLYPWGFDFFTDKMSKSCPVNVKVGKRAPTLLPVYALPGGRSVYGCYNLLGNACEWTGSFYQGYPDCPSNIPVRRDIYVARGGSYLTEPEECRASRRFPFHFRSYAPELGFRCTRGPGELFPSRKLSAESK